MPSNDKLGDRIEGRPQLGRALVNGLIWVAVLGLFSVMFLYRIVAEHGFLVGGAILLVIAALGVLVRWRLGKGSAE